MEATFQRLADKKASLRMKRGGRERVSFGIVHPGGKSRQSFLVIPASSGISVGDKISFYIEERGISFRVEKDGMYAVFKSSATSVVMRCTLCSDLADFADTVIRNIFAMRVPGGWFVPLDQFD